MDHTEAIKAITAEDRGAILYVKKMFPRELLLALREHYEANESKNLSGSLTDREVAAVSRGESSDSFRMDKRWYDVWKGASNTARDAIGPFTYVTFPVQVRCVREVKNKVPWHQDCGYMKLLGNRAPRQIITCFIPIEPDAASRTTIQFSPLHGNEVLPHRRSEIFGAEADVADLDAPFFFRLELGDALVFGDHALHRTYTPQGGSVERRSLEFRLILPRDAQPGRDYFDVAGGRFSKT